MSSLFLGTYGLLPYSDHVIKKLRLVTCFEVMFFVTNLFGI